MRKSLAVTAAALSVGVALGVAAPAGAADDPVPARQGGGWLAGQLSNGLMHNPNFGGFDDYGLSADAGIELATLGGHRAAVASVSKALASHVDDYVSYPAGTGTHTSAGSLAKVLVLAQVAGADPTRFGGRDLVADLGARVAGDGPTRGRIEDALAPGDADPFTDGDQVDTDFVNLYGQALAARGLGNARAPQAADVLGFLLAQQCPAGWFRISLTADRSSAAQGCDPRQDSADTDATSYAVIQLAALRERSPAVTAAIAAARAWLRAHQLPSGAWRGGSGASTPNANSTGLAAWALGRSTASRKAAIWLRRHQARDAGPCRTPLSRDKGAVAYDDAARYAGRKHGIGAADRDQWRRATAQALVALRYAPAATGRIRVTKATRVKGRHAVRLHVRGVAPWAAVCASRGTSRTHLYAGPAGGARPVVKLAKGKRRGVVAVVDSNGRTVRVSVRLSGRKVVVHRLHVR
jgi:hypothetical protein